MVDISANTWKQSNAIETEEMQVDQNLRLQLRNWYKQQIYSV
jgi:hypothetical protein